MVRTLEDMRPFCTQEQHFVLKDANLSKDKLARQECTTNSDQQAVKTAFQDYERSQADLAFVNQQHVL